MSQEARPAGIVSRGVAAVIDLAVVGIVLSALYVGLILTRLMFGPTTFSLPTVSAIFSPPCAPSVAVNSTPSGTMIARRYCPEFARIRYA